MAIMIAMAAYGAVTATVGIGGSAAVERSQGWGRQLGLTPLRDASYVAVKVALAAIIALAPIALIYALGTWTGAEGDGRRLDAQRASCSWRCRWSSRSTGCASGWRSAPRRRSAGPSGSIVVLGFLGNIFFPLSGTLLDHREVDAAVRLRQPGPLPADRGVDRERRRSSPVHEPLWIPVANVLAWTLVLAVDGDAAGAPRARPAVTDRAGAAGPWTGTGGCCGAPG